MTERRTAASAIPPLPGAAAGPGPIRIHAATGSQLCPMRSDHDRSPLLAQVWTLPAGTVLDRDAARASVDALTSLQDRLGFAPVRAGHILAGHDAVIVALLIDQPQMISDENASAGWVAGAVDQAGALRGFARIARALSDLHRERVVHAAVSPASLVVSDTGLLQLGLHACPGLRPQPPARTRAAHEEQPGRPHGTPHADARDLAATVLEVIDEADGWAPTPELTAMLDADQVSAEQSASSMLQHLADALDDAAALLPARPGPQSRWV